MAKSRGTLGGRLKIGKKYVDIVPICIVGLIILIVIAFLQDWVPLGEVPTSVECDLSRCDNANVIRACGDIHEQHGISDEQMIQCLKSYVSSSRLLFSLVTTSCNIWTYDTNRNCYIDDMEVLTGIDDWQKGILPLECQIDLINEWELQTKNPSCYVPTTTTLPSPTTTISCTPSCESWSSGCDTSRTCTRVDCSTYQETRSVDYCSCNIHCPDGACNCGETCNSCSTDCGTCPGPPTCPNGESTQVEYKTCTAANLCEGAQYRTCTDGTWTGWGYCTTSLEKCWDGSCQVICPTEPTTTTIPTTTTTILGECKMVGFGNACKSYCFDQWATLDVCSFENMEICQSSCQKPGCIPNLNLEYFDCMKDCANQNNVLGYCTVENSYNTCISGCLELLTTTTTQQVTTTTYPTPLTTTTTQQVTTTTYPTPTTLPPCDGVMVGDACIPSMVLIIIGALIVMMIILGRQK